MAALATILVLGLAPAVANAGDAVPPVPSDTPAPPTKQADVEPDLRATGVDDVDGPAVAAHDGRSWIVVLDDTTSAARTRSVKDAASSAGGRVGRSFSRLVRGFEVELPEAAARALEARPGVVRVEPNLPVSSTTPVGLDRIDQRDLPLNGGAYAPPSDTAATTVYVVDTAVRATHAELTGRTTAGYSSVGGSATEPCIDDHHGTHVAGAAAGTSTGVAPAATIVPVRVLDCSGWGTSTSVIEGLEWIAANVQRPAVVNMSLGGGGSLSLDAAVQALIDDGIPVVVAAGNETDDACRYSPARVAGAITVAASHWDDERASFSNYGRCVDVYAPGTGIRSSGANGDTNYVTMSGTSMAAPHVAGVVALRLATTPTATPAEIAQHVRSTATVNRLTGLYFGDPNRLASSSQTLDGDDSGTVSATCDLESKKSERFDFTGDWVVVSGGVTLDAGDRVRACLRGPSRTDYDLRLQRYDATTGTWKTSTASTGETSTEEISVEVPAGRYRWVAYSYSGEGRYRLSWMATPPTALTSGPSGTTSDTSATFKFSSRDGGARFQCRLDTGSWRNCTSPHAVSGLGDGTHTMRVRAVDADGNVDPSPAARTWTIDVPTVEAPSGSEQFVDVDSSSPFSDAIGALAAAGVTRGCNPPTNDRFCPTDPVTRQQMAAFLTRALPLGSAPHAGFTDVPTSSPFSGAVASLADAGITRGCNPPTNDQFCPGDPVTRQQMAAFLTRALKLPAGDATFRDVPASSPFSDAVAALADAGITRGCNPPKNDKFCPGEPVTRQQMAAFLQRSGVLD